MVINNTIPLIIALKYEILKINLTKCVKFLYTDYQTMLKKKEDLKIIEIYCVHGS